MIDRITNVQITSESPAFAKPMLAEVPLSGVPISEVYLMDCVEGMKHYPDKYFDLAVVDPPYGINFAKQHTGKGWVVRESKDWDKEIPQMIYFTELFRVSKEQIIWGGNYFASLLPNSQGWIFWDKGQRNFSLADGELCWTSFKKSLRVFEMSRGKMQARKNDTGGGIHPTQKPVELYDFCFNFAKVEAGAKILDTHLGSGSSRISANKNGLNFVGFEIDEEYFNKQNKRYADFTAQTRLW